MKQNSGLWAMLFVLLNCTPAHAAEDQWEADMNAGMQAYKAGRYSDAEKFFKAALDATAKFKAGDPRISTTMGNLGTVYFIQGKFTQSLELDEKGLVLLENQQPPPSNSIALKCTNIASTYRKLGKIDESEMFYKRAIALREGGDDKAGLAKSLNGLGVMYFETGKQKEAEPLYLRARDILEHLDNPDPDNLAECYGNLGVLYCDQHKLMDAQTMYEKALSLREKYDGPNNAKMTTLLNNLGELAALKSDDAKALHYYDRAMKIEEAKVGKSSPQLIPIVINLSSAALRAGRYAEAEAYAKRAISIGETVTGKDGAQVVEPLETLWLIYSKDGRFADAEAIAMRALALAEKVGPTTGQTALALEALASTYECENKLSLAEPLYKRALEIDKMNGHDFPAMRTKYAAVLRALHKDAEADAVEKADK